VASEGLLADRQSGSDPRLLFNRGVELAVSGKFDEATEVLRQVAMVRDKSVAARALSLLGQISALSAQQSVSDNPAETPAEHRQIIFNHLQSAEHSFAESLSLVPNEEVRQYLETLRAWWHNMNHVWEEYDREQLRSAELQQRVQWLANWEEQLMEKVRPVADEPNSPRKFQTAYEASRKQKQLAEELAMLQETPLQAIPTDDEEFVERWLRLPEIQNLADEAAELLSRNQMTEALPKQEQVLDYLRTLFKKEQDQQNQDQQDQQEQQDQDQDNQEQNNQGQQDQDQQQQNQDQQDQDQQASPDDSQENGEQEQEMNQSPSTQQESAQAEEESAQERAERMLLQVRRKEQAAEQRREQLRALQMQAEPVEKDW
jgi:cobalamin biosynthesis protein CobT